MQISWLQGDFSAGMLASELWGQVTSDTYGRAVELLLNYVATLRGPPVRRPGTLFVSEVKDSARFTLIIPFEFSTIQGYMLELGHLYGRVHMNGALVTLAPKTIIGATQANPVQLTSTAHGFSNGKRVVVANCSMLELNGREFRVAGVTANTFTLQDAQTGAAVDGTAFTAFTGGGQVAEVFEFVTPWTEAQLPDLRFCQGADVLLVAHPDVSMQTITRTGHTTWSVAPAPFSDGPYEVENESAIQLSVNAVGPVGASVTLTASSTALLTSNDIGRPIRLRHGTQSGWGICTGVIGSNQMTLTVMAVFASTAATTTWRRGVFSTTTGFPSLVDLYQGHLVLARYKENVTRLDVSFAGDIFNFEPSTLDGDVTTDAHAFDRSIANRDVNAIAWLFPHQKGLVVESLNGEYLAHPNGDTTLLTPSSTVADRFGRWGGTTVQPVQAGQSVLFVQRSGEMIRETTFTFQADGFESNDITFTCPEVVRGGVKQMVHVRTPYPIVWMIRNDGRLIGCTFERDSTGLRYAWHVHRLGGVSNAGGSAPKVEAIATLPSPDGKSDDLWMVVRRWNGVRTVRTVEKMAPFFRNAKEPDEDPLALDIHEEGDEPHEAHFVDCGLTLNAPLTITGATNASPVVLTFAAPHGLVNDQTIYVAKVRGMTQLNRRVFKAKNVTSTTAELFTTNDVAIDGSAFGVYAEGGVAALRVEAFNGLFHLAGQKADILGDGAVQRKTVSATGGVELDVPAGFIHAGLPIVARMKMLPVNQGAMNGSSVGKTQGVQNLTVKTLCTQGLRYGTSFKRMFPAFKTIATGGPPELVTGITPLQMETVLERDTQLCFEQRDPFPGTILAVALDFETHSK